MTNCCDVTQEKAAKRKEDLDDSLQAQQYFADANEGESWMREKEPIVCSTDYGKDEDSAEVRDVTVTCCGCCAVLASFVLVLCRRC